MGRRMREKHKVHAYLRLVSWIRKERCHLPIRGAATLIWLGRACSDSVVPVALELTVSGIGCSCSCIMGYVCILSRACL